MPETVSFTIKYDGEALADHSIDINDLAPALMGLRDLFSEANLIANEDKHPLFLKVKAHKPGSFQVDIEVVQSIYERTLGLFSPNGPMDNLKSLVGCITGLIALVKVLKGKKPESVSPTSDGKLIVSNGVTKIEIHNLEYNVYQSPSARKALYQIVKPTEKEGIDKVEFSSEDKVIASVTKAEASFFGPDASEEEIQESIRETFVHVEHAWLTGDENRKWKFKEGLEEGNTWTAAITDQDFLKKMLNGKVSISGADTMKVRVKQTQHITVGGIKSEYEIIQVLAHHQGPTQRHLNLPDKPPATGL